MWRLLGPMLPLLLCQCTGWREAGIGGSAAGRSAGSDGPTETATTGGGEGVVAAAAAAGLTAHELATGPMQATALGWHLEVAGGRARFYGCDDATTCGMHRIEVPASDITRMAVVGRTRPQRIDASDVDDEEQDVVRLTLRHPIARTSRAGEVYDENHGLVFGGKAQ